MRRDTQKSGKEERVIFAIEESRKIRKKNGFEKKERFCTSREVKREKGGRETWYNCVSGFCKTQQVSRQSKMDEFKEKKLFEIVI